MWSAGLNTSQNYRLLARGLVALDVLSRDTLFTIPVLSGCLLRHKRRLYNYNHPNITAFDLTDGTLIRQSTVSADLADDRVGRHLIKHGITRDEKYYYQISGVTTLPLLLQRVEIATGEVLGPVYVDASCNTTVGPMQNEHDELFLRCRDRIMSINIATTALTTWEIPIWALPFAWQDASVLYVCLEGSLLVYKDRVLLHRIGDGTFKKEGVSTYKLLLSADKTKALIVYHDTVYGSGDLWEAASKVGTTFQLIDTHNHTIISEFYIAHYLTAIEINDNASVLYAVCIKLNASIIDSEYMEIDMSTGRLIYSRLYENELISSLIYI